MSERVVIELEWVDDFSRQGELEIRRIRNGWIVKTNRPPFGTEEHSFATWEQLLLFITNHMNLSDAILHSVNRSSGA